MDAPQEEEKQFDRSWITVQKKTFTRWANNYLHDRRLWIKDLETDLDDGLMLINLLEILSTKSCGKFNKAPKIKPQKLENISAGLHFVTQNGIKLVGIGPEDIYDHNLKLILGLIWTLILRFQIQRGGDGGNAKAELLEWVRKQVAPYGLKPKNFTLDWTDGKVLSALTDSLQPGLIDCNNLPAPIQAVENAMEAANKEFLIPRILDAQDMVDVPDELSNMTYISYFRDYLNDLANRRARLEEEERLRKLRTADPSQCYAFGPGVEGGSTNNENPFTIQSINYFGDKLPEGGNVFEVVVSGASSPSASVKDNKDGTYSGTYLPTVAGDYSVSITLRGEPIKGSPYSLAIVGPDASNTYATGPGVEGGRVGPAPFKIISIGKDNKPVTTGGNPFSLHITAPNGQEVKGTLKDNKDGTLDGLYTTSLPGVYTVEILLDGQPIKNSPYKPLIEAGFAENCWAEGKGLHGGQTGNDNPIVIHSVDQDGKPVSISGDPFVVTISGPENLEVPVKDNGDGTHSANYAIDTPGDYVIHISLHGRPIKDSPFRVHFQPDALQSTVSGPGVEGSRVGREAPFTIQARAANGKEVPTGGDAFTVSVTGPGETVVPAHLQDNGNGTYSGAYTPTTPGVYTVQVKLNDHHVQKSPFQPLMEAANAGQSWAEGPGLEGGKATRNNPFTIHAVDADGAPVKNGGDPFVVGISGPSSTVPTIKDNGDGTYSVNYVVDTPGDYVIDVSLHGTPIKNSPFNVLIKPDVDPNFSYAEGPGLLGATDNEPAHFTIYARDGDDQPKVEGGDPFEVVIDGPAPAETTVVDNGDGTYAVTYRPLVAGDYKINVSLEGHPIKNAPYSVKVTEGIDYDNTGFSGFSFTVQTRDKNQKERNFGGDLFQLESSGPANVDFQTQDNGNGTYTASFAPPAQGKYSFTVKFNGKQVTTPIHLEY